MLCDTEGHLTKAFSVRSLVGLSKRVTFFVDERGIIREVWDSVTAAGHAEAALEGVRRWASERSPE